MKIIKCMIAAFSVVLISSCTKDLDRTPAYSTTAEVLYSTEGGYKSALAKVYGGLALTGNQGPAGSGDIRGIDEGFSDYLRTYFNLQELPTDEAVVSWNDQTIKDFHEMDWSASDNFVRALYSRLFYQITLANAFINESSDEKVNARGLSKDAEKINAYRSEARFLRALSYLHALDLFGNVTFVTDSNVVGTAFLPRQATRAELFSYIEKEGKELESLLAEPKTNEYGRVDKAALWMLMANLYLNAKVYINTEKYTEAAEYSAKVIAAGYSLQPKYKELFLADNNKSPEFIFAVPFDGVNTKSFGGTTFLTHAPVGGKMLDIAKDSFGVNGGWSGYRTTSGLVNKFADPSGATDKRALFFTNGQSLVINDISVFTDGYGIAKWRNITSTGAAGSNLDYSDVDFPIYRLAEAYLINAEAKFRLGSIPEAVAAINKVVERAHNGSTSFNYSTLTENNILDERAKELYWEAKRRTDLIRFGKFTTNAYLWPWKGGVASGTGVESFRNLYPIPSPEINSNPNLQQNTGY
jgi:starch-binding outer membrane protein, SusD/RagB family